MAEKEPPVDCLGPNARSGQAFQRQLTALEIKGGELISTHSTISTALKWEDCTTGEAEDTYYAEFFELVLARKEFKDSWFNIEVIKWIRLDLDSSCSGASSASVLKDEADKRASKWATERAAK